MNRIKNLIVIGVILTLISCTTHKAEKQIIDFTEDERALLLKDRVLGLQKFQTTSSSNDHSYIYIEETILKMIDEVREMNSTEIINFKKYYNIFKKHPSIKMTFWKNTDLDKYEAMLLIDKLIFSLEKSDFCNILYVFENCEIKFVKEEGKSDIVKFDTDDSIRFNLTFHNGSDRKVYYIGSKDSVGNKNYILKRMIESQYIKLPTNKKGINKIEGGIQVVKFNHIEFIPFEYEYIVK